MATPTGLSGTIWPIHTKPLPDELLTSWMVRIARAYGITPVWFWNFVWPHPELPVYAYLNHAAPRDLLELLADKTAVPLSRALGTTLQPFANVRDVPFFSSALHFCPECLRADEDPYFRRRWQIPSLSFCIEHSARLRWRCRCHEVLRPELLSPETHSITR